MRYRLSLKYSTRLLRGPDSQHEVPPAAAQPAPETPDRTKSRLCRSAAADRADGSTSFGAAVRRGIESAEMRRRPRCERRYWAAPRRKSAPVRRRAYACRRDRRLRRDSCGRRDDPRRCDRANHRAQLRGTANRRRYAEMRYGARRLSERPRRGGCRVERAWHRRQASAGRAIARRRLFFSTAPSGLSPARASAGLGGGRSAETRPRETTGGLARADERGVFDRAAPRLSTSWRPQMPRRVFQARPVTRPILKYSGR
jgi:hypothetical protein